MALGTYGTVRPADMSPEDVEIIMNYTPSRDVTQNFVLKKLDAASLLTPYFNNNETGGNVNEILGGLYNLQLPAAEFNALGIYTLYIRPAEIRTNITDCGILSALPNVKGIIIDLNNVDPQYRNNTHLYFDDSVPDKPAPSLDFAGNDGQPINGLSIVGSGTTFPTSGTNDNDYFLRTDFSPNRLFKKSGTRWLNVGTDSRGNWAAANKILSTFINNDNITSETDGTSTPEKVNLSKVVKPKTDN